MKPGLYAFLTTLCGYAALPLVTPSDYESQCQYVARKDAAALRMCVSLARATSISTNSTNARAANVAIQVLVLFPAMISERMVERRNYKEKNVSLGLETELFLKPVIAE